jgi:hypothetical protein
MDNANLIEAWERQLWQFISEGISDGLHCDNIQFILKQAIDRLHLQRIVKDYLEEQH